MVNRHRVRRWLLTVLVFFWKKMLGMVLLMLLPCVLAWTPSSTPPQCDVVVSSGVGRIVQRRDVLSSLLIASSSSSIIFVSPMSARAAATGTTTTLTDEEKIIKGYNRLQYLLDNWEAETTICKTGQETTFGDICERTPTKVMEYLGYKSTSDPLFKAESTLRRLVLTKDISNSPQLEGQFYDAIDTYSQNAEEANSMAFVSSWGEANPGGGKDRVRQFIERSRNNVVASRDSLKAVLDILNLKP